MGFLKICDGFGDMLLVPLFGLRVYAGLIGLYKGCGAVDPTISLQSSSRASVLQVVVAQIVRCTNKFHGLRPCEQLISNLAKPDVEHAQVALNATKCDCGSVGSP